MYKSILISSLLLGLVNKATVKALNPGDTCDPTPMYKASWSYDDSCQDVYLFCDASSNNTCGYKGCRESDYIQNWNLTIRNYPPRCNGTTFCPDNNSKCTNEVSIGSICEIQRDDECTGLNSICLNSTCFVKGAPLSANCGADTTTYTTYDQDGVAVEQTIIRDNCTTGTYCNLEGSFTCIVSKMNNSPCSQDRECLSGTCSVDDICINGPDVFHTIQSWLWGVLGAAIIIFVILVLGILWALHRYQSKKEHAKITKFFGDNEEFAKHAMLGDHDGDADSIYTDDENQPGIHENLSRTSLVYLATPDYLTSQALTTKAHLKKSGSSTALDSSTPNSRLSIARSQASG